MSYVWHIMMILTSHAISDITYDTRVPGNLAPCSARSFKFWFFFAMAAKLLVCRLCWENVPDHKATNIFTKKSVERKWPSRISALLDIPVDCGDQLPPHVCFKCLTRVISLEKASLNLASFKRYARSVMDQALRLLKRSKETSGGVGVT